MNYNMMMKSPKTGRKGDPRMHRSVAARLANPELSLFDALKIGGFEYATDEDASVIDSEKVTLAQRKNQLSRRLRFARKQAEGDSNNSGGGGGSGSGGDQQSKNQDDNGNGNNNNNASLARTIVSGNNNNNNSGGSLPGMSSEAQKQLEKLMQHSQQAKINSGVKRNNSEMNSGGNNNNNNNNSNNNNNNDDDEEENQPRRVAKFHPQYQPLFIPRVTGAAAAARNNNHQLLAGNQVVDTTSAAANGLTANAAVAAAAGAGPTAGLVPGHHPSLAAQLAQQQQQLQMTQHLAAGGPHLPTMQTMAAANPQASADFSSAAAAASPFFSQQAVAGLIGAQPSAALPSGVAIRSLTATAQSVGLTLEQLAVTLTSSSTLAKVLSDTDAEEKQEVALRLYQNEARALYARCMLLAGFHPEDASENTKEHLEFALAAWQVEGKRLQELVGNETGEDCLDAPDVANTGDDGQQQQEQVQAQAQMSNAELVLQQQQQQQEQQQQQQLQEQQFSQDH